MSDVGTLERALRAIICELRARNRSFALVGGLAVSIRAEVRFTRVDIATVRADLTLIRERGFDRGQDLQSKLASILDAIERDAWLACGVEAAGLVDARRVALEGGAGGGERTSA